MSGVPKCCKVVQINDRVDMPYITNVMNRSTCIYQQHKIFLLSMIMNKSAIAVQREPWDGEAVASGA